MPMRSSASVTFVRQKICSSRAAVRVTPRAQLSSQHTGELLSETEFATVDRGVNPHLFLADEFAQGEQVPLVRSLVHSLRARRNRVVPLTRTIKTASDFSDSFESPLARVGRPAAARVTDSGTPPAHEDAPDKKQPPCATPAPTDKRGALAAEVRSFPIHRHLACDRTRTARLDVAPAFVTHPVVVTGDLDHHRTPLVASTEHERRPVARRPLRIEVADIHREDIINHFALTRTHSPQPQEGPSPSNRNRLRNRLATFATRPDGNAFRTFPARAEATLSKYGTNKKGLHMQAFSEWAVLGSNQ